MKNLKKILLLLGVLLGLFACSSLPTEEDNSNSIKSSVQFTMQNIANSANSNILFSSTDEQTPSKVAISYKKSGEGEAETSTTIELTAFGSSYITDDVLSLYEGNYELTKFDVLNDTGETIYSTPVSGSDIATSLDITTPLAHNFDVREGEVSMVKMQVVEVSDTTNPADFGHAAFTFDKVDFSKFYIDVLVLDDSLGWVYTTAQVEVKNAEGSNIKTASIDGKMNKVIVANSDSYKITVSKDGYASQEFSLSKDDLAKYEKEAMVVKLKASTISTEGLVAYFPLNGNANDESGTGNDGTECGGIDYVDGKIGKCAKFDGAASEYITSPNSASLSITKSFTLSAWVYSSSNIGIIPIITKGYYNEDYTLWFTASGSSLLLNWCKNYQYWLTSSKTLNINEWYLLTTCYDYEAGKISYYINGTLVYEGSYNHLIDTSNEPLYLGSSYPGDDEYFAGLMDEVRIYNRALSQEEVTALYNEAN